ncbi:MAG: glycerophosphodiester phosphodiesterase [Acidobacteriia bacterium]|nr:glycerophosphodiester phosphodiesterase [Terriglobia bacterium]
MPDVPLLLGHRGARVYASAPENTFASFDLALEQGCDGFEFDVRGTADRRLVVCHDPKAGRVIISRATRPQLPSLPRLEDVLARYGRRVFLDIELKVKGLESAVLDAIRNQPPERGYMVSSFSPAVVLELKARCALVPLGIISERASQLRQWRELPVDYVIAHQLLLDRKLVEEVHAAGRKLFAWTVNDVKSMRRLADWGVDAIISDDPKLLVGTLRPAMPGQNSASD